MDGKSWLHGFQGDAYPHGTVFSRAVAVRTGPKQGCDKKNASLTRAGIILCNHSFVETCSVSAGIFSYAIGDAASRVSTANLF